MADWLESVKQGFVESFCFQITIHCLYKHVNLRKNAVRAEMFWSNSNAEMGTVTFLLVLISNHLRCFAQHLPYPSPAHPAHHAPRTTAAATTAMEGMLMPFLSTGTKIYPTCRSGLCRPPC